MNNQNMVFRNFVLNIVSNNVSANDKNKNYLLGGGPGQWFLDFLILWTWKLINNKKQLGNWHSCQLSIFPFRNLNK